MAPEDKHFGIDLKDEVVRGSIVTYKGDIIPSAPRPAPPPAPAVKTAPDAAKVETVAITPWQKTSREVATVTGGMGLALILGKATGPLFMSNVFTFALAGLIGYRTVWGVVPALHSPLMSVTNAISGNALLFSGCLALLTIFRHGRSWWFFHHGRRSDTPYISTGARCIISLTCVCKRFWWVCNYEAHAGYV
jgi:hypothetical protein